MDVLEEPHVEDKHEEGADLHMLVKIYNEENIIQSLIDIERKDEELLSMGNINEGNPIELSRKNYYHSWIGLVNILLKRRIKDVLELLASVEVCLACIP